MIWDARQAAARADTEITLGADKDYEAAEFIEELHRMKVTPHVAQNKSGRRSAVADEIARSEGLSDLAAQAKAHRTRLRLGQVRRAIRQVMMRGIKKVDQLFVPTMSVCNFVPMRTLAEVRPLAA